VPFPPELLTDDEELVLDLRPHWWYIAPASVYLAVAFIVGLLVWTSVDGTFGDVLGFVVGIALLVALGYFAYRFSRWSSTNFVVTNERVVSRSGVVAKRGIEIPLDRINTVFFSQSFFERIIGAGDLGIESAGEGGRETFSDIRKPSQVQHEIYRQKERFEQRRMTQMGQSIAAAHQFPITHYPPQGQAPAAGGYTGSIPEQIEHLDRLRRSGAITEAEFQAKKTELLGRL
jgi:membrane protein YdbS with pleckstrin-like domain